MLKPFALLNLLVVAVLLPFAEASSNDALYRDAPVAGWVLPATPDYDAPEPAGHRAVPATASETDEFALVLTLLGARRPFSSR